jgi:hypothetical protein
MQIVTINSSSLSAITGQNPFLTRFNAFLKLFKQNKIISAKPSHFSSPRDNFCALGIKNEGDILKKWSDEKQLIIKKPYLRKKALFQLKNKWILSGVADGLTMNNDVVEVKYRTKMPAEQIPIYDYIQVQSYMQLYDSDKCYYVQCFENNIYSEIIHKDDEFWILHILPKILEFANVYEKLCNDPEEMQKFLYFSSSDN